MVLYRLFHVLAGMKRPAPFFLLLTALSAVAGWLLSHLNLIGRIGVHTMHTEYRFLTVWWKGALLVWSVWMLFWAAHTAVSRRLSAGAARATHAAALVLAALGWYATYHDFRNTLTHRIIGERFHLGAYLFWLGWMLIALRGFSLIDKPKTSEGLQP